MGASLAKRCGTNRATVAAPFAVVFGICTASAVELHRHWRETPQTRQIVRMIFCAVPGNVCYDPAGARRWPLRGFSKGSIAVRMLSSDFLFPLSANDSVSSSVRAKRVQTDDGSFVARSANSWQFSSARV